MKILLTDIDGVLLDWSGHFNKYLQTYHAAEILPKFKQAGYDIICCTAMGHDPYSYSLRKQNLENVFPGLISRVDVTGFGQPKTEWLSQYKGSGAIWVEDKWANAIAGATIGLNTYLMRHEYNASQDHTGVKKIDNWIQLYNEVN